MANNTDNAPTYYIITVDGRFLTDKKVGPEDAAAGNFRVSKDFRRAFWYQKGVARDNAQYQATLRNLRSNYDGKVVVKRVQVDFSTVKLPALR